MKTAQIVSQMVGLLEPLPSEDRLRVVKATMTLLGEEDAQPAAALSAGQKTGFVEATEGISPPAAAWMKQNGFSVEQLQEVFQINNGKVEVIAVIPGKNVRDKVINAYVIAGMSRFIPTGELGFDDKTARELCASAGCYDNTNHSKYLKYKENLFSGSKNAGWFLTAPGRKHAAELVKELVK